MTLADVDDVVAVSVDDRTSPRFALVHMIDADDMRDRFDRAYAARVAAGHKIPVGRGVWVPLYLPDAVSPPSHVGGGAGIDNREIARVLLKPQQLQVSGKPVAADAIDERENCTLIEPEDVEGEREPLTIWEAKRRLALSLGVHSSNIKITVEA